MSLPLRAESQKRIECLCELMEREKDPRKMTELARELNALLEAKTALSTSPKKPVTKVTFEG